MPLFLASNVALLIALVERRWLLGLGAAALTGLSLAIQGRGHSKEPVPAEPFTGPRNAIARILLEQWVTFPRIRACRRLGAGTARAVGTMKIRIVS